MSETKYLDSNIMQKKLFVPALLVKVTTGNKTTSQPERNSSTANNNLVKWPKGEAPADISKVQTMIEWAKRTIQTQCPKI